MTALIIQEAKYLRLEQAGISYSNDSIVALCESDGPKATASSVTLICIIYPCNLM